jgi:eukaryotic-like serine/threonine-protein kinase
MSLDQPIHPNAEPIPGYRLIERIGRGGYGEVWKAEAPGGMHKAIKFVFGEMDGLGECGKAAEQEYKSLNRVKTIRHPFLLSLERIEVINGRLVIVMELADKNLQDRFNECVANGLPGIPRGELLGYMEEAAEALDLMNVHHQIQHLDVKPHNIFLVQKHVKVADFGLAKDLEGTRADVTGGITPTYASPETFEGWVSRQSDQYSLAIVYQEMLTGKRPFTASNTRQLILQHLTAVPDVSPLAPADRDAVSRALAKTPGERFKTCAEFVRALRGLAPSTGPGPADRSKEPEGREGDTTVEAASATDHDSRSPRKNLPALVTQSSKSWPPSAVTQLRRSPGDMGAVSPVGPPPVERLDEGVLFPALVLGIGGTGWVVLRQLRRLIQDRYGRPTLPHLQWLLIDSDPAAIEAAVTAPGGLALGADEVLLTRLHRPSHYLTRDGLPPIDTWLSPEVLYQMPRTPATDGVRAIGRLALCDHYHVVCHRIRAAIEAFIKPDPLAEADRLTRLGVRSNYPRVYLTASVAGATGSGMFLDMVYLLRREVRQLGFGDPHVVALMGVPALTPEFRDTRAAANARAALSELHYYTRPGASYRAQFDTREEPLTDGDRPLRRCALVRFPGRLDTTEVDRAADVAAHIAYADLLTPVGRAAHPDTAELPANPHCLVGVQRVTWPRARVLQTAGRMLARRTLQGWVEKATSAGNAVPAAAIETQWNERHLSRSALRTYLAGQLAETFGEPIEARIEAILNPLADGSRLDLPDTVHARATFHRLLDLLGRPGVEDADHANDVGRVLAEKVREVSAQADAKLAAVIVSLVEQPGLRLAGAEEAIRLLRARIEEELDFADREAGSIEDQVLRGFPILYYRLTAPLEGPAGRRVLPRAETVADIQYWAVNRYHGMLARACANVYRALIGNIPEYVREVNFCRSQLTGFLNQLTDVTTSAPPTGGVCTEVFPDGSDSVGTAATKLVDSLGPEERREFENGLQARIRNELRAVVSVCVRPHDHGAAFTALVLEQAIRYLDARTPRMPAAGALLGQVGDSARRESVVAQLVSAAAPAGLGVAAVAATALTVIGVPDDDSAADLRELIRRSSQGSSFLTTTNSEDILILRETRGVSLPQLPHFTAEVEVIRTPDGRPVSAHSRRDVPWARTSTN